MRLGRPAIIYHITYDDGEEVPAALTHSSQRAQSALIQTHAPPRTHAHRWQRTCARSRHGEFARWRQRCSAFSSAGAC